LSVPEVESQAVLETLAAATVVVVAFEEHIKVPVTNAEQTVGAFLDAFTLMIM
jgi:hypothetical protein